jgi:DMSO reductase anchor subunit
MHGAKGFFKFCKVYYFSYKLCIYFSWYGSFTLLQVFFMKYFLSPVVALKTCAHIIIVISSETLAQISHKRRSNSAHQPAYYKAVVATRKKCPQEPSAPVPQYKATKITDFVCTFLDGQCSVIISLICEASECVNKKCTLAN